MKNIHILPTDKPSRLSINTCFDNVLELWDKIDVPEIKQDGCIQDYNICITNDEEIKEGDWFINVHINSDYIDKRAPKASHRYAMNSNAVFSNPKKIILTTDQDLIKDGVQSIDDEFLEWFVKNPRCEEVEVGYGWIRLTETDNEGYWVSIPDKQFEMQQEEPKQETLEEAIKREYETRKFNSDFPFDPQSFKLGAKWQQERMYSEEEVYQLLYDLSAQVLNNKISTPKLLEKWFEQFKKKV